MRKNLVTDLAIALRTLYQHPGVQNLINPRATNLRDVIENLLDEAEADGLLD